MPIDDRARERRPSFAVRMLSTPLNLTMKYNGGSAADKMGGLWRADRGEVDW